MTPSLVDLSIEIFGETRRIPKSKNHIAPKQSHMAHKNGIKNLKKHRHPSTKGINLKFLRNQGYAKKHNNKTADSATEDERYRGAQLSTQCAIDQPDQVCSSVDVDSSVSSLSQPYIAESLQDVQQKAKAEPGSLAKASLYVTDLDASVTETDLNDLFGKHGQVLSVKICRDLSTGVSRGYGFINFCSLRDATKARKLLNSEPLKGKRIRAMLSNRDSNLICGERTIFFKNFDACFNLEIIDGVFSTFGTISTSELAIGSDGRSKGFGYILFDRKEAAEYAMSYLKHRVVDGRVITTGPYICKDERDREKTKIQNLPTLYVENVTLEQFYDEFESAFSLYGRVVDHRVVVDGEGYFRDSVIVIFENFDDAVSAIKGLNGKHPNEIHGLCKKYEDSYGLNGKHPNEIQGLCKKYKDSDAVWYVRWAISMFKTKHRRQFRLEKGISIHKKLEGVNLYIKNFNDDMTERKLKGLFSEFGMVTYSKIIFDSQGRSRCCGFIGYVTPEDATKAMNAMNGKIIGRKPLHVSVARRKKEGKASLQNVYAGFEEGNAKTEDGKSSELSELADCARVGDTQLMLEDANAQTINTSFEGSNAKVENGKSAELSKLADCASAGDKRLMLEDDKAQGSSTGLGEAEAFALRSLTILSEG